MKKIIACMLAAVMLLPLAACGGKGASDAAASAVDKIKEKGQLVVGTSADYPPY